MRLLADTHVLVWAFTDPDTLSRRARTLLEDLRVPALRTLRVLRPG